MATFIAQGESASPVRVRKQSRKADGSNVSTACPTSRPDIDVAQVWHQRVPTRPSQTDPEQLARWQVIRRQVGSRIRAIRIEQGLTQEALALEAGMSRNQLVEVEHGRRSLLFERIFDVAAALGVEPGVLLVLEGRD